MHHQFNHRFAPNASSIFLKLLLLSLTREFGATQLGICRKMCDDMHISHASCGMLEKSLDGFSATIILLLFIYNPMIFESNVCKIWSRPQIQPLLYGADLTPTRIHRHSNQSSRSRGSMVFDRSDLRLFTPP